MTIRSNQISWDKSIFFFDVDDTLIATYKSTFEASQGIENVFSAVFDKKTGIKIRNSFHKIFDVLSRGHFKTNDFSQEEIAFHDEVLKIISERQQQSIQTYGCAKKWSREIFIWYAAQLSGLKVTPEIIEEAADAYWVMLSEKTVILPGVVELLRVIHAHKRPVYLVTGSDARLKMQTNGQFLYDPESSEALKRERMELLRDKGIIFHGVSIGDPEDKPHKDFFQKAITLAQKDLGHSIDLSNAFMVGDSYAADLEVPKEEFGFGLVVLLHKNKVGLEYVDEHYVKTENIADILKLLK